jgi:hypothetical protein
MGRLINGLRDLVDPISVEQFKSHVLEHRPIFIRSASATRAEYLLPEARLNGIVAQAVHTEGRVVLTIDERIVPPQQYCTRETRQRIDPAAIRRLLDQGASLIVNEIDDLVPEIGDLAQALEWEFGTNTWVNAYVSFTRSGAFRTHYDNHDVIALQVSGAKRWFLFGDERADQPPATVQDTHTLRAGDVLFVPRGHWHRAEVSQSPSVHLTISVSGLTGADFVRSAFARLLRQEFFLNHLPRLGGEAALKRYTEETKVRLRDWVETLSASDYLLERDSERRSRARSILLGTRQPASGTGLRLALRRIPESLRRNGKSGTIDQDRIIVGGQEYALSPIVREILALMCEHPIIKFATLVELLGEDRNHPTEIVAAVIELMEHGLINRVDCDTFA